MDRAPSPQKPEQMAIDKCLGGKVATGDTVLDIDEACRIISLFRDNIETDFLHAEDRLGAYIRFVRMCVDAQYIDDDFDLRSLSAAHPELISALRKAQRDLKGISSEMARVVENLKLAQKLMLDIIPNQL